MIRGVQRHPNIPSRPSKAMPKTALQFSELKGLGLQSLRKSLGDSVRAPAREHTLQQQKSILHHNQR
jgi:hypothetical protein